MTGGTLRRLGGFAPGLVTLLGYDRGNLRFDIVAGLSVAAVALPVGIAYAEIARVPAWSASTRRFSLCSPMRCSAPRVS